MCGLLLLAVIAVFGQTAGHNFVDFDDDDYVYENQHVKAGLTGDGVAWAFTDTHVSAQWHPLTWLSLMADAQVLGSGEGPLGRARLAAGMHLVNVALHAANAVILLLVLWAMTASVWQSALVAAVFAVHPLHVESVAWITERKDVLSGLFGLLALGAYAWYARGPSIIRYLSVVAALALGLMAKPMLVTWPLLFLLLDYWPLRRPLRLRLVLEKVPLLLLVAASAAVTFLTQRFGGAVISLESVPLPERLARAAVLYVAYLGKTFWPVNLAAVYPRWPMASYWPALGAGVLLALLTAGALWGARREQPWLAVGWFWFLGTLLPTIGLVQVGMQVMADRFLYLPQVGLCIAVAWELSWAVQGLCGDSPSQRCLSGVEGALLVAGLMACAWQQAAYWKDDETLWSHTLACTSKNWFAHTNLGNALIGRGQVEEAIAHYRKALEINPDYALAHNNLGLTLASHGRFDEALVHYRKALEIRPDFAEAHNDLGLALADHGQVEKAIAQYRKALEINPDYADARYNLGTVLAGLGQVDEAIAHYRKALETKPDHARAHNNLANALLGRGQVDEAIAHYRKALEINPDYIDARYNLGTALAGRGQVDEAITHFRKILEIQPEYARAWIGLGDALAGRGRLGEALEHYQKALDVAIAHNDRTTADAIRARIKSSR